VVSAGCARGRMARSAWMTISKRYSVISMEKRASQIRCAV
jgi:hypothetical protein